MAHLDFVLHCELDRLFFVLHLWGRVYGMSRAGRYAVWCGVGVGVGVGVGMGVGVVWCDVESYGWYDLVK